MTTLAAKPTHRFWHTSTARRSLTIAALFVYCLAGSTGAVVSQEPTDSRGQMMELRGQTMGTTYMVKIFDPPQSLGDAIVEDIDGELRRVNDQMSTYLKSSEISRFNTSSSTDWFDVSDDTAMVIDYALEVSRKTDGAFDITVGPLVNLWSFGPEAKKLGIPSDEDVNARRELVGYQHVQVRREPPAIRKSKSEIQIDLSAIAKGHGVDRIVKLLGERDARNVFVEIGGEVRVTGDKSGDSWMVGIQQPDSEANSLLVRHALRDRSMATSGDYRNRFEVDGQFFSHTIDPRSGRPITHGLASVTVIAEDCMRADAWATAIDVLGPDAGLSAAKENGLDVLLATRTGDTFAVSGTGTLAEYAHAKQVVAISSQTESPTLITRLIPMAVLTLFAFGIVLAAMAIGVMFGRRPISGSCGGLAGSTNEDGSTRCSLCSNPADACKELRERIQKEQPS